MPGGSLKPSTGMSLRSVWTKARGPMKSTLLRTTSMSGLRPARATKRTCLKRSRSALNFGTRIRAKFSRLQLTSAPTLRSWRSEPRRSTTRDSRPSASGRKTGEPSRRTGWMSGFHSRRALTVSGSRNPPAACCTASRSATTSPAALVQVAICCWTRVSRVRTPGSAPAGRVFSRLVRAAAKAVKAASTCCIVIGPVRPASPWATKSPTTVTNFSAVSATWRAAAG